MHKPNPLTSKSWMGLRREWIMQRGCGLMSSWPYYGPFEQPRWSQLGKPPSCSSRSKGVLPIEVAIQAYRITTLQEDLNIKVQREALDLLPMVRGNAYLKEAIAKIRIVWFYNRKVMERPIRERDTVPWKMQAIKKGVIPRKLTSNWEGPYIVIEELCPGMFRLLILQRERIPRTWHANNPRRYCIWYNVCRR